MQCKKTSFLKKTLCPARILVGSTAEDEPDESDSGSILSVQVAKNAIVSWEQSGSEPPSQRL